MKRTKLVLTRGVVTCDYTWQRSRTVHTLSKNHDMPVWSEWKVIANTSKPGVKINAQKRLNRSYYMGVIRLILLIDNFWCLILGQTVIARWVIARNYSFSGFWLKRKMLDLLILKLMSSLLNCTWRLTIIIYTKPPI